jgi:hypothetical protein
MKKIREIRRLCEELGLKAQIERSTRHIRIEVTYKGEQKVFFSSATPSDGRTEKNFRADVCRWLKTINTLVDEKTN